MSARSPQVAWKIWLDFKRLHLSLNGLTAVDLAKAFTFAAERGWARGALNAPVSSDEPNGNDVLRTSTLFGDLLRTFPTGLTRAEAAEVSAAIALAPPSWRAKAEHSNLMINLPRGGAA
ncbi:hypothetical protein [Azospirillum melinis]